MTKTPPERPAGYDALPQRFKRYIESLESTIGTLRTQVPYRTSKAGASLQIVDRLHHGNDGYLPDDTEFAWHFGAYELRVKVARDGADGIEVTGVGFGGIVVYPYVSNVVVIRPNRRDA